MMADLSLGVFRNERYADRPDSELLERVQLEWAGRDRERMPRRVHGLQMIGDRAGVVDHVVEQLRPQMALNRQHVLDGLDMLGQTVGNLRESLEQGDNESLLSILEAAAKKKRDRDALGD